MRIQSIKQQNINYKGIEPSKLSNFIADHPIVVAGIAGSSAVTQKIIQSSAELLFGPNVDVQVGKAITKVTKEKDGRTNQSSKVQAVRTIAQTVGGTITGVAIRAICIGGMTYALIKMGGKAGEGIAKSINKSGQNNAYEISRNAAALGRNMGGIVATFVMMATNFLLDVPIINFINKKVSDVVFKNKEKEVKNG